MLTRSNCWWRLIKGGRHLFRNTEQTTTRDLMSAWPGNKIPMHQNTLRTVRHRILTSERDGSPTKAPENPKFASSAPWKCCRDPLSPVWSLFNSQVINSSCCARNTAMIIFICREVLILSSVRCNAPDILFIITKDIHSIYKRCHLKSSTTRRGRYNLSFIAKSSFTKTDNGLLFTHTNI